MFHTISTMRKMGVLQLALQFNFWVPLDTCNSSYINVVGVIGQVARVARVATHCIHDATHYNSIMILLQQILFNYYAIPLWLQS
jgi:hypothetical protein